MAQCSPGSHLEMTRNQAPQPIGEVGRLGDVAGRLIREIDSGKGIHESLRGQVLLGPEGALGGCARARVDPNPLQHLGPV